MNFIYILYKYFLCVFILDNNRRVLLCSLLFNIIQDSIGGKKMFAYVNTPVIYLQSTLVFYYNCLLEIVAT